MTFENHELEPSKMRMLGDMLSFYVDIFI